MRNHVLKAIIRVFPVLVFLAMAISGGCASSPRPKEPLPSSPAPKATEPATPHPSQSSPSPSSSSSPPLTLAECIKIALAQNPLNRAAQEGVTAAREKVGEATAPYYPEIGLNAGYSRWQKYAFLPSGISRPGMSKVIGPTDDWTAGLKARLLLFDSGERKARLTAALAGQWALEEDAERARQDIIMQVHQAYYGLRSAQEARSVAGKNLARAEDHLRLATERKEAGAAPKVDVIRAQGEVAQARLTVVKTENLVRIAKGKLNIAMGSPVETRLQITDQPEVINPPDNINIYDALDQATRTRPALKAALFRVAAARREIRAARSTFGPKIRAEGGYGWRGPDRFPDDEEWLAGITLDWPIFTGFSSMHLLSRTRARALQEEAEAERLALEVQDEVWSAYSKLQETYEAIQTAQALIQTAQEGLRLARERYEAGSGSMSDLLDTQTTLAQAEASHLEAQWDYLLARASFQRAIGQLGQQAGAAGISHEESSRENP